MACLASRLTPRAVVVESLLCMISEVLAVEAYICQVVINHGDRVTVDILVLNPPFHPRYSRSQRSPAVIKSGVVYYPIWLAYTTGVLEQDGFAVSLVDAPAAGLTLPDVLARQWRQLRGKGIDGSRSSQPRRRPTPVALRGERQAGRSPSRCQGRRV